MQSRYIVSIDGVSQGVFETLIFAIRFANLFENSSIEGVTTQAKLFMFSDVARDTCWPYRNKPITTGAAHA